MLGGDVYLHRRGPVYCHVRAQLFDGPCHMQPRALAIVLLLVACGDDVSMGSGGAGGSGGAAGSGGTGGAAGMGTGGSGGSAGSGGAGGTTCTNPVFTTTDVQ